MIVGPDPSRVNVLEPQHRRVAPRYRRNPTDDDGQIVSFWVRLGAMLTDVFAGAMVWALVAIVLFAVSNFDWGLTVPMTIVFAPTYTVVVVLFVGLFGQSPGKALSGIKIVRSNGMDISFGRAILRETIGKLIASLPLIVPLGFLWVWFDGKNQGWHDKLADTKVIRVRR